LFVDVAVGKGLEMVAEPVSNAETAEAKITKQIAAAGVRLRFDKVALRLLESVKTGVVRTLPKDQSILFTVTAPIKLPAKTTAALQEWLCHMRVHASSTTINGNHIRARLVKRVPGDKPRVLGFVHNTESKADALLEIAELSLREL
jgi:hypothetical protein